MSCKVYLSRNIFLILLGISIITAQVILTHLPKVVFENTVVTLTCQYNGNVTVKACSWSRNTVGAGILNFDASGGCYAFTDVNTTYGYSCPERNRILFRILNVTQSNNGDVWNCEMSLQGGLRENSNNDTIIVQVPVTSVEIIEPTNTIVTVKENTPQVFKCRTSVSRPIPTIQWYLDDGTPARDKIITDNVQQKPSPNENALEATNGTLSYTPTRSVNGWRLYCSAQNINSSRKSLNITYPPSDTIIEDYPKDSTYSVIADKQQTLTCRSIDSNPLATLHWSCFTGSVSSDSTTGTTVANDWSWSTYAGGKCTCVSVHIYGNQSYGLNVKILNAVDNVKFLISNTNVSGNVKVIHDSTEPIVCSASGTPTITYRWTHGTMNVTGDRLLPKDILQDGTYTCSAYNTLKPSQGEQEPHISTSSVDIIRLYPSIPVIRYGGVNGQVITEPLKVVTERQFTLYCHAASSPKSSYTWNRGISNGPQLTISSLNDDAQVMCIASTTMDPSVGDRTTQSRNKSLSVGVLKPPTMPVIAYHHSSTNTMNNVNSISVIHGNSFNISCVSTGIPTPSVSWTNTPSTNTKIFLLISKKEAGMYSCMAQNSMNTSFDGLVPGTSLNNISINVLYEPVVNPLSNITIVEGHSPRSPVVCEVTSGNPRLTNIKWTKGSVKKASQNGVTSLQLPLSNVQRTDDGTYNCTAENTMVPTAGKRIFGRDSEQFHLIVFYNTSILKFEEFDHPGDTEITVMESNKTQLNCVTDSKPGSTIFIKKGQVVKQTGILTNNLLYPIKNATCLDTGNYTCVGFNNRTGQVTGPSKNLQLYVKCGPRLSPMNTTELNQTSTLNVTTALQIYILVYPAPKNSQMKWLNRTGDTWNEVKNDRMKSQISTNGIYTTASLTIQSVQRSDFGEYRLHVEHEMYDADFPLFFNPKDKPSPPTNTGYAIVTVSSAVIYWTPGFDGGFVQTFIIMYTNDDSQWLQKEVVDTKEQRMNITLEHLKSGSSYIVRIYATNKLGNSSAQSDLYFATGTELPPPTPAALIGGTVTGSVVVITSAGVVVIIFFRRKQIFKGKHASNVEMSKRPVAASDDDDDDDDDDDGMKPNPMYVTSAAVGGAAGGSAGGAAGHNDVYATPIKKGKPAAGPQNSDIYAQVQKKNKTAKKKEKKGKSNGNNKGGQMGDVYENVQPITGQKASTNDNTYENPVMLGKSEEPRKKNVNKDGLIYADLAFNDKQKGQKKLVIIGSDDRTPYAQVDFTKKADPLPDSDDEK